MAKIPTYQDRVDLDPLRAPTATPAAFGAGTAQQLGRLGGALQQTSQQLLAIELGEDRSAARAANTEFRDRALEARSQYMQRRGTDAANVDVEFRRDLEKFRKEIAGKLGNPRQQEIFTATASSEIPGYVDRMRGHRIQQGEVARQTTRAAEDQTGINEIQADPYNEEVFLNSLQDRVLNLNAILTEQGVTDSTAREAALQQEVSRYHRIRVGTLLADVTPESSVGLEAAEDHLKRYNKRMDAATKKVLGEKVRLVRVGVDAQDVVNTLMSNPGLTDSERLRLVDQGEKGKGGEFTLAGVEMTEEVRGVARQELVGAIQRREQVKRLYNQEQVTLGNNELNEQITENKYPGFGDLAAVVAKTDMAPEVENEFVKNWKAAITRFQKGQSDAFQKGQYARLRTLADVNSKKFVEIDLYPMQALLKQPDWERLVDLQNKIRNGETDSPQDRTMREVRKTLRSAIRTSFPVRAGKDATQAEVVAASFVQSQKLYDMESFIDQRFKEDAERLSKVTDPALRQKYVNNVLLDAFRKFNLDDGWFGFGESEVFNFEKEEAIRAIGADVGEVVETQASLEEFEKRTGVPAGAPRHPNGNIVVRDREDIENVLRRAGETLPFQRDDGGELKEIIVRTNNLGEVVQILPNYAYPDIPAAETLPEPRTQAEVFSEELRQKEARATLEALGRSDPFIASILADYYETPTGKAEE